MFAIIFPILLIIIWIDSIFLVILLIYGYKKGYFKKGWK